MSRQLVRPFTYEPGSVVGLDHPGLVVSTGSTTRVPGSRRGRPPAAVVSTGSTTRGRGLDGLDHPRPWSQRGRPPGSVVATGPTARGGSTSRGVAQREPSPG